jgi:hypothetical protein
LNNQYCEANECNCANGLGATGAACTSNGGAICGSCTLGFEIRGKICEAHNSASQPSAEQPATATEAFQPAGEGVQQEAIVHDSSAVAPNFDGSLASFNSSSDSSGSGSYQSGSQGSYPYLWQWVILICCCLGLCCGVAGMGHQLFNRMGGAQVQYVPTVHSFQAVPSYTVPVATAAPVSYTQPVPMMQQPTYLQPTTSYAQPTMAYAQPTMAYAQPTTSYTPLPQAQYAPLQPTTSYAQPMYGGY